MKIFKIFALFLLISGPRSIFSAQNDNFDWKTDLSDIIRWAGLGYATGFYFEKIINNGSAISTTYSYGLLGNKIDEVKVPSGKELLVAGAMLVTNAANISMPNFFSIRSGRRILYTIIGACLGCARLGFN